MNNKTRLYIGIMLLLVGVLSLFMNFTSFSSDGWAGSVFFLVISAFLFVAYSQTGKPGFLIAASSGFSMGVFILLVNLPFFRSHDSVSGALFFALQGLAFAAMYLFGLRRRWTLMVAAWAILFAVFIGLFAEGPISTIWNGALTGGAFFVMVGLAFLSLKLFGVRRSWPLYAAAGSILFGVLVPVMSGIDEAEWLGKAIAPTVLVIVGLFLLFRRREQA